MKILAVGAHPDDVEFGCAPILIQEIEAGHEVRILVTSRGEAASSGTPLQREREAREAAAIIGAAITFLDLGGDCRIEYKPSNAIELAREVRAFRPEAILAPHLDENQHPDHVAVGRMIRDATRFARYGGLRELRSLKTHSVGALYYYSITQVFNDAPPDLVIDVTAVHEKWMKAMACHKSQMQTKAYPTLVNSRAQAIGAAIGVEYAIGLWANDPIRVRSLADLPLSSRNY
jgi:N-acetylglucosamine malate deacetylase 1